MSIKKMTVPWKLDVQGPWTMDPYDHCTLLSRRIIREASGSFPTATRRSAFVGTKHFRTKNFVVKRAEPRNRLSQLRSNRSEKRKNYLSLK